MAALKAGRRKASTSFHLILPDMEAIGPVLLLLSIPLIFRWVPRNHVYGFRTAATLADESVWYDVNALSGRHMFALGLVMVILEFALPSNLRNATLAIVGTIGVAAIVVGDWRTANRWRRERENDSRNRPTMATTSQR